MHFFFFFYDFPQIFSLFKNKLFFFHKFTVRFINCCQLLMYLADIALSTHQKLLKTLHLCLLFLQKVKLLSIVLDSNCKPIDLGFQRGNLSIFFSVQFIVHAKQRIIHSMVVMCFILYFRLLLLKNSRAM